MPTLPDNSSCFLELFKKTGPAPLPNILTNSLISLYTNGNDGEPVYFIEDSWEFTAEFNRFKKLPAYQELLRQYDVLLEAFRHWALEHEVVYHFVEADKTVEAFAYLRARVHAALTYDAYHSAQPLFLNAVKQSLEELWIHLQREDIPVDLKKQVILNLQASFTVCLDGFFSNLLEAATVLGGQNNATSVLYSVKREQVRQIAVHYLKKLGSNDSEREIHMVNHLYNAIADMYSLEPMIDAIATDGDDTSWYSLRDFQAFTQSMLTPKSVLDGLCQQYALLYNALIASLKERYFKLTPSMSIVQFNETVGRMISRDIEAWNSNHESFCSLTLHDVIGLDKSTTEVFFSPRSFDRIKPLIARGLRCHYLSKAALPSVHLIYFCKEGVEPAFDYNHEKGVQCFFDYGVQWFESEDEVVQIDHPEALFDYSKTIAKGSAAKAVFIATLLKQPGLAIPDIDTSDYGTPAMLAYLDLDEVFDYCIKQNQITREHLFSTIKTGPAKGMVLVAFLMKQGKVDLVNQWLSQQSRIAEILNDTVGGGETLLSLILACGESHILENAIQDQRISAPQILSMNLHVSQLLKARQFGLIQLLLDRGLFTQDHFAEVDLVCQLVLLNQTHLLKTLIEKQWVTPKQLAVRYQEGSLTFNVVSWMFYKGYLELIQLMLAHQQEYPLIEERMLKESRSSVKTFSPIVKPFHVYEDLVLKKDHDMLSLLFTKHVVAFADIKAIFTDDELLRAICQKYRVKFNNPLAQALRRATGNCDIDVVRYLLDHDPELVNVQDDNPSSQRTALHIAVEGIMNQAASEEIKKSLNGIMLLLCNRGAKMDISNGAGKTALDIFPGLADLFADTSIKSELPSKR